MMKNRSIYGTRSGGPGFIIALLVLCLAAKTVTAQYVSLTRKETHRLRNWVKEDANVKRLFDSMRLAADAALGEEPNPIDTIRTEGLLQGDPRKTATSTAMQDLHEMYALAMASRMTRKAEHRDKRTPYLIPI